MSRTARRVNTWVPAWSVVWAAASLSLSLFACTRPEAPATEASGPAPEVAPTAGSGAAEAGGPRQATPVPPDTVLDPSQIPGARASGPVRERLMRWATRGASQSELAEIMREVLDEGRPRDVEAVLFEVARMLSTWRAALEPELVAEVARFGSWEKRALWERVDGRFVPPLTEILLDAGDPAAVIRLAAFYDSGPAAVPLQAAAEAARSWESRAATVTLAGAPPCRVRIDGELADPPPWQLVPGTYRLSCDGDPIAPVTLRVGPSEQVQLSADLLPP